MEKDEIKCIADNVKELEEGLDNRYYHGPTAQHHLTKLHLTIERLIDMACNTKDQQLEVLLATLECEARRSKERIKTRLAVKN